ncbi:MAG: response regulator, partial [Eubacterium sp.]|nr:response regulator [Eubacterium sp.]
MRILIVEDEKSLNEILEKHLKSHGYAVDSCYAGDMALDYILSTDYDAIILDIMLPGLSGLEVLSRARARDIDTPILLLTARYSVADKVQGLDAGADDYLTKPFALEELLARIRMLLRKKAG